MELTEKERKPRLSDKELKQVSETARFLRMIPVWTIVVAFVGMSIGLLGAAFSRSGDYLLHDGKPLLVIVAACAVYLAIMPAQLMIERRRFTRMIARLVEVPPGKPMLLVRGIPLTAIIMGVVSILCLTVSLVLVAVLATGFHF